MVNLDQFLLLYDEFSCLAPEKIEFVLAASQESVSGWNSEILADSAVYALTAHKLLIQYQSQLEIGGALALLNEREEFKFSRDSKFLDSNGYYGLTPYGLEFLRLREENSKNAVVFRVI